MKSVNRNSWKDTNVTHAVSFFTCDLATAINTAHGTKNRDENLCSLLRGIKMSIFCCRMYSFF